MRSEETWPSLDVHCSSGGSIIRESILWTFYWEMKEQQSKLLILTLKPSAGGWSLCVDLRGAPAKGEYYIVFNSDFCYSATIWLKCLIKSWHIHSTRHVNQAICLRKAPDSAPRSAGIFKATIQPTHKHHMFPSVSVIDLRLRAQNHSGCS